MEYHRRLDTELDVLRDRVLVLGGEAEAALVRAMYALTERDSAAAREVLEGDDEIDKLEVEIDRLCIDVLALRQPAARDLRFVISVAKITPILERLADHACNIARVALDLNDEPRLRSYPDLSRMAEVASSMLRSALDAVKDDVLRLGAKVEDALERAGRALAERDTELADSVRWDDREVNDLQRDINTEITTLIATQAPVARDVRELLALYHASAELERMGDYAVNIAKLAQQLASEPETPIFKQIPRMEQICREQLRAAMRALVDVSEEGARGVCERDDEIDHLYNSVYEDAIGLMEAAPERARQATHMLFAAHHLERLGDRVTNIGEDVVFLATGQVEDLNP